MQKRTEGPRRYPTLHSGWWLVAPSLVLFLARPGGLTGGSGAPYAPPETTPHSEARLVSEARTIRPGSTFAVALAIDLDEGWHTYWLNPGDSGTPAILEWSLPTGFHAGPILWPAPERIPTPPLMSYAYTGHVMLLTEITVPPDARSGTSERLGLSAEFLVCREICLPAEVTRTLDVRVATDGGTANPTWAAAFAAVRARLPMVSGAWQASAVSTSTGYDLVVHPPRGWDEGSASFYFFVDDPTTLKHAVPQQPAWRDGSLHLTLERSAYNTDPDTLDGVLERMDGGGFDAAGTRPALALTVPVQKVAAAPTTSREALAVVLFFAFVGGALLNLMPCVFPVLSLKIVSFVHHAGGDTRRTRLHGMAFAMGVILSFVALAVTLLAVRAAGAEVGWGFQLQSPAVVAALCVLLFVIGLGFAGVVEAGASLTRLAGVGGSDPRYRGSFLTGVLATVVATPCTAPFMGVAVGAALVRPSAEALGIFGMLGVGMATPYVVLSSWPGLLRSVPRPGAWMETLKQALAFPMFAVSAWLVWVFGLQTGMDGAGALLGCLVLVGFAAWAVGRWPAVTSTRWALVTSRLVASLAVVAAGAAAWRGVRSEPAAASVSEATAGASTWRPFEEGLVETQRRAGRPVFVDFTAAWCISCQVNERLVLSDDAVLDAFRARGVVLVKADWTRREPDITRALASFGRSGVPLYVLYPPDPAAGPKLLPAMLTTGIVLDALDAMEASGTPSTDAGRINGGL
jgi:thiol:disulfide interchange protein/DsbC/DsbD-like thiol-disulfide interchange protein